MPNIKKVNFYFAIPQVNSNGNQVVSLPPETHTLTWQQLQNNVGFSLSTGESMFTELPDPNDDHLIRVVNGFYFGTGRFGRLLAIQYVYEDDSDGWISEIKDKHSINSLYTEMMVGNWIKGLSYQEIQSHANWKGIPYIGLQDNYIEVRITRNVPDMTTIINPVSKTITKGESVTFTWSSVNYCEGPIAYEWEYNSNYIEQLNSPEGQKILQFKQVGNHAVTIKSQNACGQTSSASATITVLEPEEVPCDLQLSPTNLTIRLGETATFSAMHPYSGDGTWTYDSSLSVIEKSNKTLKVSPNALGSYSISYSIDNCQTNALLYVLSPLPSNDWEDPVEPAPPLLPNTPPDGPLEPGMLMELFDITRNTPPLDRLPSIVKRNARYRGHRESEKFLNNHQEQIYEIRQIYKELGNMMNLQDKTIQSWFAGLESISIFSKSGEKVQETMENPPSLFGTSNDSAMAFSTDVVQLMSGGSFDNRIIGIDNLKERIQQLDERIAEAKRRYRDYENAYK